MPAIKKRPAHADLFVYQSTPQQSDDWPLVLAPASPAVTLVLPVLSGMFEVLFVCRLGAQLVRVLWVVISSVACGACVAPGLTLFKGSPGWSCALPPPLL